jgi:poly(A) polymerase
MAEEICRRLRFSNEDTAQIAALVANHMKFKDVLQMKPSTLKRFARLNRFDEHLELHRLDCLSSHRMLNNYDFAQKFVRETPAEQIRPARLLTGDDLMALGFQPGPSFKQMLDSVEEAQLNDLIHTREEAIEFLKSLPAKNQAS